jgi:hypothetical protein
LFLTGLPYFRYQDVNPAEQELKMPEIAEIEDTSNPYAVKFILKELLTWGITRTYDDAVQAKDGGAN